MLRMLDVMMHVLVGSAFGIYDALRARPKPVAA